MWDMRTSFYLKIQSSSVKNEHIFIFLFFLNSLTPREFNSYGSRRGNDAVMARGTFANIRLVNKFIDKQGPQTIHFPSGETVSNTCCFKMKLTDG